MYLDISDRFARTHHEGNNRLPQNWDGGEKASGFSKCRVLHCPTKSRHNGADVLGGMRRWRVRELADYRPCKGLFDGERANCARQVQLFADSVRRGVVRIRLRGSWLERMDVWIMRESPVALREGRLFDGVSLLLMGMWRLRKQC